MKSAQNPSIVSYRTHRITDLGGRHRGRAVGLHGAHRGDQPRRAYEKQAATGSKEFLDLLYSKWLDRSKTVAFWSELIEP